MRMRLLRIDCNIFVHASIATVRPLIAESLPVILSQEGKAKVKTLRSCTMFSPCAICPRADNRCLHSSLSNPWILLLADANNECTIHSQPCQQTTIFRIVSSQTCIPYTQRQYGKNTFREAIQIWKSVSTKTNFCVPCRSHSPTWGRRIPVSSRGQSFIHSLTSPDIEDVEYAYTLKSLLQTGEYCD